MHRVECGRVVIVTHIQPHCFKLNATLLVPPLRNGIYCINRECAVCEWTYSRCRRACSCVSEKTDRLFPGITGERAAGAVVVVTASATAYIVFC